MNDAEFLDYCETHADTERAGFTAQQIERLYELAAVVPPDELMAKVVPSGVYSLRCAGELVNRARKRLSVARGPFLSPLDTLPEQDAGRWRHVIEMCQSWPKTREQPHPPMRAVVEYVIPAGTRMWSTVRVGTFVLDLNIVLSHPPTHEAFPAFEQTRDGRWLPAAEVTRPKSVPYLIRVHDPELYAWLFAAGYLAPPPAPFVDNRKAPTA